MERENRNFIWWLTNDIFFGFSKGELKSGSLLVTRNYISDIGEYYRY